MLVVKLGGSIITYKRSDSTPPYRWKESNLHYRTRDNAIRSVAIVLQKNVESGIIFVHGGGTHGHRTVKRWDTGAAKGKECMRIWEVKWRMVQLTERIVHIMGEQKLPVVSVSPSDIMELDGRSIVNMDYRPIMKLLECGCIPILRGDLASDINGSWSVVSGDEIMIKLVEGGMNGSLPKIDTAIMCLDIDGFYKGLSEPNQEILGTIDRDRYHSSIDKWKANISSGLEKGDVSGGILRKVAACHRISAMGSDSWMIGGEIDSSLSKVLAGEHCGTKFPAFNGDDRCKSGKCGRKGG